MTITLPQPLKPLNGEALRREMEELEREMELNRALLARVQRSKQRTAAIDEWIAHRQKAQG